MSPPISTHLQNSGRYVGRSNSTHLIRLAAAKQAGLTGSA